MPAAPLFDVLVDASIGGGVFALCAWAVARAFGRLTPAARCTLWWLVALKLIVGLLAVEPMGVPLLPATTAAVATAPTAAEPSVPAASAGPATPGDGLPSWRAVVIWCWIAGVAMAGAVTSRQWRALNGLRQRARKRDGH